MQSSFSELKMANMAEDKTLRCILFDFDNTLVDSRSADARAFEQVDLLLSSILQKSASKQIIEEYKTLFNAAMVDPTRQTNADEWRTYLWDKAIKSAADNCKISAVRVYELWKSTRLDGIYFRQEIKTLLEKLRKKYILAVVTNGDALVQREKLARCDAKTYFDAVVVSSEEEHPKPHPSIFHNILSSLKVRPHQTIMVGDTLETDILGGQNAGLMATIWVQKSLNASSERVDFKPDYTVESLLELTLILTALSSDFS